MALVPGNPHAATPVPAYYTATVRAEQSQHWYSFNFTSEDTWYWDQIQDTAQHTYDTTLCALASGPYSAIIRGEIVARSSHPINNPDHHTKLWLNSQVTPFDDRLWDGISRYHFEASVPSNQLVEGANQIRLGMLTDAYPSQIFDWLYFDWFEIDYRRQYLASNDQISFSRDEAGTSWKYEVNNFASPEVMTLNITNPLTPQLITGTQYQSGTLAFEANHSGGAGYLVVGSNAIKTPISIAYYQPPDLLSLTNQYDYLIITHNSLAATAQSLANYRASQGLTTRIVDVNDLYNLFNYGIYHSIAIKNFLKYTFTNWAAPPSFVVLIGDGHWNFKGFTGPLGYYSPPVYIPPHLSWVDPWQGEVDSANLLGAVVGNDPIADVHIGRIPVNNASELNAVVNKIIAYEQSGLNTWQRNIMFVADNVPDPAGDFIAESEQIITDYVESGYTVNRIYENAFNCTSYPCPLVNYAITNTINTSGAFLVNYNGHASVNRWSHEHIFTNPNIQTLTNSTRYPVVVSLTCLDGYWIHPGGLSPSLPASGLMEDMLRATNKGAVATFSPTGLGVATGHEELWRGFYQALFKDSIWNLGEATLAAKLRLFASGANYDLLHTFTLFGDPALRVKDPYTFGLTPTAANRTRAPGSIVHYTLQLTNNGLVPDTFTVGLSGNQWIVTAPTIIGPVNPGATTNVPVTVYVSFFAPNGAADTTQVAISSQGDTSEKITATLTTSVEVIGELYLTLLPQIVK